MHSHYKGATIIGNWREGGKTLLHTKNSLTLNKSSRRLRGHLPALVALVAAASAGAAGTGCGNDSPSGGAGSGAGGASSGVGGAGLSGATFGGMINSAGSPGFGGSSGGALNCTNVSACGGDVVGTWNVTSSCLKLSGDMDMTLASLGCRTVPVNGALQTTGTFTVKADGTYSDKTKTTGFVTFPLQPSCLSISSVNTSCNRIAAGFTGVGWDTGNCTEVNGVCNCSLNAEQDGGFGTILSYTEATGPLTTAGTTFTATNATYSYCVSGNTLTATPQMSALTGTVVFQREGSSGGAGAGGMSGTAGAAGAGGKATGGAGGAGGSGGAAGSAGAGGGTVGPRPCDIYAAANTPCKAAHSMVRALFASYNGRLYQVKRASDGMTKDIPVLSPGGFANSAEQDDFCRGTTCTVMRLYDQSGNDNFLEAQIPDSTVGGFRGQTAANAAAESLTVSGNRVYSLFTRPSQAYWNDGSAKGMPLGAEPQGVYMVTSGEHFNSGCCYNYGNGQTSRTYEGGPTMDSVYFGNCTIWGTGAGKGPWVMADMEDGILSGRTTGQNPDLPSMPFEYVTAMEKNNGTTEFSIKGGNATTGTVSTFYKGALPNGKSPMKKEGAVLLGAGGDCCYSNNNASEGTFYEGAIVAGYPSDATDDAIHANIVNAGYGK